MRLFGPFFVLGYFIPARADSDAFIFRVTDQGGSTVWVLVSLEPVEAQLKRFAIEPAEIRKSPPPRWKNRSCRPGFDSNGPERSFPSPQTLLYLFLVYMVDCTPGTEGFV